MLRRHRVVLPMSFSHAQSFNKLKYNPVIFGISSQNAHHEKYKTKPEARLAGAGEGGLEYQKKRLFEVCGF